MFHLLHLSWVFVTVLAITNSVPLSQEDQCMINIRKEFKGARNISRSLGGIVGTGLDALTNDATLPVLSITYDQCKTVPDGDFLIPDNIIVFPIKEANIQAASTIHDSLSNFKLDIGASISTSAAVGLSFLGASGSFSLEAQLGVKHMRHQHQTCFVNKVEYKAFDMIATESAGFHPAFLQQVKEIADAFEEDDILLAQYAAENLIANYGTHVTNKALAGASITMLSFTKLDDSKTSVSVKANLSANFKANFLGIIKGESSLKANLGLDFSSETKDESSQTYIITKGGADVNRLLDPNNDNNKLHVDSVVGIKFSAVPLYTLVHEGTIKTHKNTTMKLVQEFITDATQEYYRHNTIPGCMKPGTTNYFYKANVDDNSCMNGYYWPGIGGVFQKCEHVGSYSAAENGNFTSVDNCKEYEMKNPFTKDYTCVPKFNEIAIDSFYVTVKNRSHSVQLSKCTNSSSECYKNYDITDEIKVTAYWCTRDFEVNPDYDTNVLFGGIFSTDNVFSDNKGCPNGFTEYPFLHNLKICMTAYSKNGLLDPVVGFDGMITCHSDVQECAYGFSRYLAATIDHCPYYYCAANLNLYTDENKEVQMGDISRIMSSTVSKPPYIDRTLAMKRTRYHHKQQMKSP